MLMLRTEQIMVCEGNASFAHHMVLEEYYNQLIRYATITVSFAPKLQTAAQHFAASQNDFAQQKGGHQNTARWMFITVAIFQTNHPTVSWHSNDLPLLRFYPVVIKENQTNLFPFTFRWRESSANSRSYSMVRAAALPPEVLTYLSVCELSCRWRE